MDTKEPRQLFPEKLIEALDQETIQAFQRLNATSRDLMSCYRCAIMEIETKFRVLNERFSLHHDRNPIDAIQNRLKPPQAHPGHDGAQEPPLHPEGQPNI